MVAPLVLAGLVSGGANLGGNLITSYMQGKQARKQRKAEAEMNQKMLDEQRYEFDKQLEAEAARLGLSREELEAQKSQFGQQFGEAQRISALREQAYSDMLGAGKSQMAGGEEQFMAETAPGIPSELADVQKDIAAGTTEGIQRGTSEMQAAMAQQGVRGGQAATQLRRGIGEMRTKGMMDINQLSYDAANRKRAAREAYLSSKALTGQRATLTPAMY